MYDIILDKNMGQCFCTTNEKQIDHILLDEKTTFQTKIDSLEHDLHVVTDNLTTVQISLQEEKYVEQSELRGIEKKINDLEKAASLTSDTFIFDRKNICMLPSDRWSDPLNVACNFEHAINDGLDNGRNIFNDGKANWKELSLFCNCFHCALVSKTFADYNSYSKYKNTTGYFSHNDFTKREFCPLDSNCTCLNKEHRMAYFHSLEFGYIRDRDLELSPTQIHILQNMSGRMLKDERKILINKWGRLGYIVNITKDGYQYKSGQYNCPEKEQMATKEDLYYTNGVIILDKVFP